MGRSRNCTLDNYLGQILILGRANSCSIGPLPTGSHKAIWGDPTSDRLLFCLTYFGVLMVDPILALTAFTTVVVFLVVLFWPRHGLASRIGRLLRMTERVRMEDALKHLFDGEYTGKTCSVESLAGALEMSRARAARLVNQLEAMELIHSDGRGLPLTNAGREYALRLLRTHRLWERYLADRTNVKPLDWHDQAERQEHALAPAETEELAARIGHPLYDPHGDPIPTATGEMPPQSGVPLTALTPGQSGAVVHLEDEPREVFQKILDAGLVPLMRVQVIDMTPETIRFTADGETLELEPVAATNVTVVPLPHGEVGDGPFDNLTSLRSGESATVVQIAPTCQGLHRRRLLDLGFVPGTLVTAELEGTLRDPVAYRVRGALIALRKQQAEWIYIDRSDLAVQS